MWEYYCLFGINFVFDVVFSRRALLEAAEWFSFSCWFLSRKEVWKYTMWFKRQLKVRSTPLFTAPLWHSPLISFLIPFFIYNDLKYKSDIHDIPHSLLQDWILITTDRLFIMSWRKRYSTFIGDVVQSSLDAAWMRESYRWDESSKVVSFLFVCHHSSLPLSMVRYLC